MSELTPELKALFDDCPLDELVQILKQARKIGDRPTESYVAEVLKRKPTPAHTFKICMPGSDEARGV